MNSSLVARIRNVLRRILRLGPVATVRSRVATAAALPSSLAAEIREMREMQQRVAELTDLVAEVLVPLVDRDDPRVQHALAQFRRDSF